MKTICHMSYSMSFTQINKLESTFKVWRGCIFLIHGSITWTKFILSDFCAWVSRENHLKLLFTSIIIASEKFVIEFISILYFTFILISFVQDLVGLQLSKMCMLPNWDFEKFTINIFIWHQHINISWSLTYLFS